jgi:C4-dicarboxylate-specific signal transduction histidine kinase
MVSDPDECIRLAEEALRFSERHSFRLGIAQAHMHIGLGKYHQGELAAALEKYRLAEAMFLADNEYLGLRSVYNNIGIIYDQWRDRDRALEYYRKNLELEDKCANPNLSCTILVNIGNIHSWSNDLAAARECFDKALKLARESGNEYAEGLAYSQIGHLLKQQKCWEEAVDYLNRSYEVRTRNNDLNGMIKIHLILGDISLAQDKVEEALEHDRTAMRLARQLKDKNSIAISALNLAAIYQRLNDKASQKENLELCLSLAGEQGYRNLEVNALRELAHWQEEDGDLQAALKTYWRYQEAKNYLTDLERNQHIQQLRIQLQVSQKEREMELIRKTNAELEKKNRTIQRQKDRLEKAEAKLRDLNRNLEQRVQDEIDRRRRQEQFLIQKSKLESLGRMAAGIAHEINQPLGMINLGIQNLVNRFEKGELPPDYIENKLAYFNENMERIKRIIEHVRLFSRDQRDRAFERLDARDPVLRAVDMIRIQCRDQNIGLDLHTPLEELPILGDPFRLEQVVLNLLSNAIDAINDKFDRYADGRLIAVKAGTDGKEVLIGVEDNGNGIPESLRDRVFEPFFTTKEESRGTGLGLSICYGIINDMGGSLDFESKPGQGTRMTVRLPGLDAGGTDG